METGGIAKHVVWGLDWKKQRHMRKKESCCTKSRASYIKIRYLQSFLKNKVLSSKYVL